MFRICFKKRPTGIKVHIDVVLATTLVNLHIRSVNADYVANLAHYWTLFEPVRVDDHHSEFEFLISLIAQAVERAIDDFEGADPLALTGLDWVGRVDDNSIYVYCICLFRVQRLVFYL